MTKREENLNRLDKDDAVKLSNEYLALNISNVMHQVCPVCDGLGKGNFEADSQEICCDSCEGTGQIVP